MGASLGGARVQSHCRRPPLGSPPWPPSRRDPRVPGPRARRRQRDQPVDRPARRGLGRGPGRPAQPPPGHEHRLHDPARPGRRHLGAGHLPAHALRRASTRRWSRAPASSCTPSRRSTPTAARSRSTPARSAWSASASCSPGSSGAASCWPPRACSPPSSSATCRSCPAASGWSPPPTAPPSATCSRTRAAAGRRSTFEVAYAAMQGPRSAAEVIEALDRLDRDPAVDVIVIARGGGSVEDLLPFSDEALIRAVHARPHPGGLRDRPRARLAAARPGRRRPRLDPDRRRQAGRARHGRGAARRHLGPRPAPPLVARLARPRAGRPRRTSAPGPRWPTRAPCSTPAPTRSTELRDRARRTLGHRLDRAADDIGHQRARARALSPLATLQRGYAVLQDADGHVVTSVGRRRRGAAAQRPGRRRPDRTPPPTGTERPHERARCQEGDPDELTRSPSYEAAREELIEVVRRLEAGGTTLEESLALWERGEQLATICQDVARRRPQAARRRARPTRTD